MTGTTKKETRAHTLLHGCMDISIIYIYTKSQLNVIDSLGLSFQIKWCCTRRVSPFVIRPFLCVCAIMHLTALEYLQNMLHRVDYQCMHTHGWKSTCAASFVIQGLPWNGVFKARQWLWSDIFFRRSPTFPFLPLCTNLCGCKRINREGFALQNVLRLFRNSKAC